jgi:CRISPR-associated protein Csd1
MRRVSASAFITASPWANWASASPSTLKTCRWCVAEHDPQYPSLFRLLAAVAVQNKADNIPPNLGGAIVDAIFAGVNTPYPSLWLNAAVGRCRAEQNVNYLRTAAIKACINRQMRHARFSSRHPHP